MAAPSVPEIITVPPKIKRKWKPFKTKPYPNPKGYDVSQYSSQAWSPEATTLLIREWKERKSFFQDSFTKKSLLWNEVAQCMQALGYEYNGRQCHMKWRNINHYFRVCRAEGGDSRHFPEYCRELADAIGEAISPKPEQFAAAPAVAENRPIYKPKPLPVCSQIESSVTVKQEPVWEQGSETSDDARWPVESGIAAADPGFSSGIRSGISDDCWNDSPSSSEWQTANGARSGPLLRSCLCGPDSPAVQVIQGLREDIQTLALQYAAREQRQTQLIERLLNVVEKLAEKTTQNNG